MVTFLNMQEKNADLCSYTNQLKKEIEYNFQIYINTILGHQLALPKKLKKKFTSYNYQQSNCSSFKTKEIKTCQ